MKSTAQLTKQESQTNSNVKNLNSNQTDKVFDAISMVINQSKSDIKNEVEFIEALKLIIKENESSNQRKKDNVAWMCTIATFFVFCLMLIMVVVFGVSVHSISNNFIKRLENMKRFQTDLNLTDNILMLNNSLAFLEKEIE